MSTPSLDHAIATCLDALSHAPACIFSDFDGTLSYVAPTPTEAYLAPGAAKAITSLDSLLDGFVIVTGRGAKDAADRIGIDNLDVVGNHGLEQIVGGLKSVHPGAKEQIAAISEAVDAIGTAVDRLPYKDSIVIENKLLSASIHYRLSPDPDIALAELRPVVAEHASSQNLVMTEGKYVIELRPTLTVNKGTAVQHLIESRRLAGAVILGDDVTDVDAFLAIRQARAAGLSGIAVAVISPETHHSVLETADIFVNGVDETVRLLAGIADGLSQRR